VAKAQVASVSRVSKAVRGRAVASVVVEVLVWWALLVGVWDLTLSGTTIPEISAAAAAGLASAVAGTAARRVVHVQGMPVAGWLQRLRWLPVVAIAVVADTVRVLALAGRHLRNRDVCGSFRTVWLRREPGGVDMHRALATLAVTSTPGSLVCDADPEQHSLLEHRLVDGAPNLEEVVAR
jgi:multisubunit Na+/H+ antiporter MnhE subunit